MSSNSITDIRRIEADLYRFLQTTSEGPRLIHDYLGDLLFRSYVTQSEHDEEIEPLKEDRDQYKQWHDSLDSLVTEIRDFIQRAAAKNFPDPDNLLTLITSAIHHCEFGPAIDDDTIFAALDRAHLRPAFTATVVFSDTRPAECLNSDTVTQAFLPVLPSSPLPHDHENKIENTTTDIQPLRTPRRLPGIKLGERAA